MHRSFMLFIGSGYNVKRAAYVRNGPFIPREHRLTNAVSICATFLLLVDRGADVTSIFCVVCYTPLHCRALSRARFSGTHFLLQLNYFITIILIIIIIVEQFCAALCRVCFLLFSYSVFPSFLRIAEDKVSGRRTAARQYLRRES